MKRITVQLSEQEIAQLDALAMRQGRSRSAVIRDAISSYSAAQGKPLPSWIGMIENDDGSLTSANTEEWLRANWHPE